MNAVDLDILSRTVWGEARGESHLGKIAVARVIINRFNSGKWFAGKTIAETCQKPWQFSCWNAGDPNRAKMLSLSATDPTLQDCRVASEQSEHIGNLPDWFDAATHYHTANVHPEWAHGHSPVGQIGAHLFYTGIN